MARISRNSTISEYYHAMVQGINKEYIFKEEILKNKYKDLLLKKSKLNKIAIISYCIMDNHVHILIKTENSESLSKMMSQINSSYGKFYNKIKNRVGYVFRDRYRAEPIYDKNHLHNCVRYIHENPVKAGIIEKCDQYLYSSFNDYKNNKINKSIIEDIYGTDSEYMAKIIGKYQDYNFIETNNEYWNQNYEDFKKVSREYENVNFNDKANVSTVSRELKSRCNVTNEEIIKFMKLKRATYYNIMKKEKNRLLMDVPKSRPMKNYNSKIKKWRNKKFENNIYKKY